MPCKGVSCNFYVTVVNKNFCSICSTPSYPCILCSLLKIIKPIFKPGFFINLTFFTKLDLPHWFNFISWPFLHSNISISRFCFQHDVISADGWWTLYGMMWDVNKMEAPRNLMKVKGATQIDFLQHCSSKARLQKYEEKTICMSKKSHYVT